MAQDKSQVLSMLNISDKIKKEILKKKVLENNLYTWGKTLVSYLT